MPDRTAGRCASDTCAVVISTETESGFITEDDTYPVCHNNKFLPEVGKNPVDTALMWGQCQLASLDKNIALREIKLSLSYLQGKSTTMSVIAHQTEKEWISANEKSRQRMSQTQAEGAAEQHAARLEEAHLRAHHSCFTSERC
ncbi:hypothetical protein TNCV_3626951 [Trichonephila clavipes]|nr:hypothetical protein TNCV_3626951 [Trichonephila clavipes]